MVFLRLRRFEAQFERKQLDATKKLDVGIEACVEEMIEWLRSNRLVQHAALVSRVAGVNAVPSDIQYLTEENIEELGSAMTHVTHRYSMICEPGDCTLDLTDERLCCQVEKMRLHAAVEALRDQSEAAESERE